MICAPGFNTNSKEVGKLFSGSSQKKGEDIYNQAYAQYRQEHQQEIFDAQDQEQADALEIPEIGAGRTGIVLEGLKKVFPVPHGYWLGCIQILAATQFIMV